MPNLVCIIYGNIFAEFLSIIKRLKKPNNLVQYSMSKSYICLVKYCSRLIYQSCRWKRVEKLRCAFVLKKISTNLDTYNRPAM